MDLAERSPPPKRKKKKKREIVHGVIAGNVEAPATRDSFAPQKKKRMMVRP
jgi:hypothetical protein